MEKVRGKYEALLSLSLHILNCVWESERKTMHNFDEFGHKSEASRRISGEERVY